MIINNLIFFVLFPHQLLKYLLPSKRELDQGYIFVNESFAVLLSSSNLSFRVVIIEGASSVRPGVVWKPWMTVLHLIKTKVFCQSYVWNPPARRSEISTARVAPASCIAPSAPTVVSPKKNYLSQNMVQSCNSGRAFIL